MASLSLSEDQILKASPDIRRAPAAHLASRVDPSHQSTTSFATRRAPYTKPRQFGRRRRAVELPGH